MDTTTIQPIVATHFAEGVDDVYAEAEMVERDAVVGDPDKAPVFEQRGVLFPKAWSANAVNIVSQKYFRGQLGSTERESSLAQLVDRVVDTLAAWGTSSGLLGGGEAEVFARELRWLLVNQRAAFNSPVWFNIGVLGARQQGSACFILSVDDTMESILDWYGEEGRIFKGGSGAGVNLSRIRSSKEQMNGGGAPSGPVSFMRGADASAGTIKSGGKTRRAAKMVILDADHPDIAEFVGCKALEERKARALADAGFDMSLDGTDSHSVQYQNANNSVRLTDEFMHAALAGGRWDLLARTTGEVVATIDADGLLDDIANAAWECADPGVQFDTTINRWNTAANTGRISASNPCSEYLHLDNSACNLASLNLAAFVGGDGAFDVAGFRSAVRTVIVAQEILVGAGHYPTEAIADTTRRFRQLGLGYTNLGAALMVLGLAYDSDEGRAWAAAVTALMTGAAYEASAEMAARVGPFDGFGDNREPMLGVLAQHRDALARLEAGPSPAADVVAAARRAWDSAVDMAAVHGVRNSQATVLAPTGTISFMMDCDTTGIEPDLGLVKTKKLVGGGEMQIVNDSVAAALGRLGYTAPQAEAICEYLLARGGIVGAPGLHESHLPVFACSMGDNTIAPWGHVAMMAAVQPWLSGGISKTVNVPKSTTPAEIKALIVEAWQLGVKAVAFYRDGCKLDQPLTVDTKRSASNGSGELLDPKPNWDLWSWLEGRGQPPWPEAKGPERQRLPRTRTSRTFEFRVADCKGFATVGEYSDGRPGEIFFRVSKQGSTLAGIMDGLAMAISHGLQYGVPLKSFVGTFKGMRFEPAGLTDDPDIRIATSLLDYVFRRLAVEYLDPSDRHELGVHTTDERLQPTLPGVEEAAVVTSAGTEVATSRAAPEYSGAPICVDCGTVMVRAGSCFACSDCGNTSGCS